MLRGRHNASLICRPALKKGRDGQMGREAESGKTDEPHVWPPPPPQPSPCLFFSLGILFRRGEFAFVAA